MRIFSRRLDLQAKISLILVAVVVPTYLIVTVAQNQLTGPLLRDEFRQVGVTSAKTLAVEIVSQRMLQDKDPGARIEAHLKEFLYNNPNLVRVDVIAKDPVSGQHKTIASNIEEDPDQPKPEFPLVEAVTSEFKEDSAVGGVWEIGVPIEQPRRDPKAPRKLLGSVHVVVSTALAQHLASRIWRISLAAAAFSIMTLILALGYFLRRTIANDRKLRQAESQNLALTEQLHEAQRSLMNSEKLAVMGQLTASFAHEIGTPLNAIGGHLQLLREEAGPRERLEVIEGQVQKIESIVKNFLQSTGQPQSQRQLVDVNRIVDQTLGIVGPRSQGLGVETRRSLERAMGPIRVVPVELEQILLNLMNNSLDSIQAKVRAGHARGRLQLEVETRAYREREGNKEWAEVVVFDTGEGIPKTDLSNVLKPFFTTKAPGQGTGLGLTICQQIARKYGGVLEIESKEGSWTRVTLRIPY